jgi:hypothetical protein
MFQSCCNDGLLFILASQAHPQAQTIVFLCPILLKLPERQSIQDVTSMHRKFALNLIGMVNVYYGIKIFDLNACSKCKT